MGVEGQVVGDEREVCVKERLEAPPHDCADHAGVLLPEETVVDDDHLRAGLGRPLEELTRGRHAAGDLANLGGSHDLEAHGAVIGVCGRVEKLV
jgi:hypothetical protein